MIYKFPLSFTNPSYIIDSLFLHILYISTALTCIFFHTSQYLKTRFFIGLILLLFYFGKNKFRCHLHRISKRLSIILVVLSGRYSDIQFLIPTFINDRHSSLLHCGDRAAIPHSFKCIALLLLNGN